MQPELLGKGYNRFLTSYNNELIFFLLWRSWRSLALFWRSFGALLAFFWRSFGALLALFCRSFLEVYGHENLEVYGHENLEVYVLTSKTYQSIQLGLNPPCPILSLLALL